MLHNLLERVLSPQAPAFALLHRPDTTGPGVLEVLVGEVSAVGTLAEIPIPEYTEGTGDGARHDVLVLVPYRQIAERGYACVNDGESLIAITVTDQATLPTSEVLGCIPDTPIKLTGGNFDIDDDTYATTARRIIADEIGEGVGANFVIKRSFTVDITDYTSRSALTFFRHLMECESGVYWTYIVHTGSRTFIGASPERHISVHDGTAVMNPISGTYRYPQSGPTLPEVMDFLADRKEIDELYMVVDEELKMMARICDCGCRVVGPYLKEMACLAHTEYFIEGRSSRDVREILRETMFAPTVTGSPVESACEVISRYEPEGRGYYSGVVALIGRDERGNRTLDSSILIRTADIDSVGRVRIGVGATLVRHSDAASEVAETRAKAAGLLAALGAERSTRFGEHPSVRAALAQRNATISGFWLAKDYNQARPAPSLAGCKVLIVDAEDTFTSMFDLQLRTLGVAVTICRFDDPYDFNDYDLVVMGPGPGDPRQFGDVKISRLRSAIQSLLDERRPFLAVCLSHQVLSTLLGFGLIRLDFPNQGVQKEIDLFETRERVGFYNTFAAWAGEDKVECPGGGVVEVSRDAQSGEVHALRGAGFASMQFHAESVLTEDGVRIVSEFIAGVLSTTRPRPPHAPAHSGL
jgi:phenazine biosynthesis protein phzE